MLHEIRESPPQELTQVPFSKTECGVDFNINTDTHERLLVRIKEELNHPLADSYHIIVSLLHYLLMTLNRRYSAQYHLPFDAPMNHHAFEFKQLLEKHILQYQQVADCFESERVPLVNIPEGFYPHAINYMIKGICPKCSK